MERREREALDKYITTPPDEKYITTPPNENTESFSNYIGIEHIQTPEGCFISIDGQGHLPCFTDHRAANAAL